MDILNKSNGTKKKKSPPMVSAEEAVEAFKRGEMLIVVDDEERENEGDLVIAAEFASPEAINFMARHGRGLVCVPITPERARELDLAPMTAENSALLGTAFTVSVDALRNTTTGISAFDRAVTIQTIVDPHTVAADLGRPGHVFPLIANPGGVISRPGHTEAVVDLAKAAGMVPAGVLCEILDDNGTMARLPRLIEMAERFHLKITSVADLITYRYRHEKLVKRLTDVLLPTRYGNFRMYLYEHLWNSAEQNLALVKGDIADEEPLLVRIHSECLTGDTFGSFRCDCGEQLHDAMQHIEQQGRGIILYLAQEGRGIGLSNKMLAYKLQEEGKDTVEANEVLGFKADLRDYWFAAQMLQDLQVKRVRLMTNNPQKVEGLSKYGVEVVERVPTVMKANQFNCNYLHTKREKLGHHIAFDLIREVS